MNVCLSKSEIPKNQFETPLLVTNKKKQDKQKHTNMTKFLRYIYL